MSSRSRKWYPKTKTSKRFCQEKYACERESAEAEYECEQCCSIQCSTCEAQRHRKSDFTFHDRRPLTPPSPESICQCPPVCSDRNFADLLCETCEKRFCHPCYDNFHKVGSKRQHKKVSLTLKTKRVSTTTDGVVTEKLSVVGINPEVIVPISPVENSDEFLTFMSLPQEDAKNYCDTYDEAPELSITEVMGEAMYMDAKNSLSDIVATGTTGTGVGRRPHRTSTGTMEKTLEKISLDENSPKSFLLVDKNEVINVDNEDDFVKKLGCDSATPVKVLSIFGNTGDGKSHTLNHTFFKGSEVFKTSAHQTSCTVGVWAAYDSHHNAVIIDTEGLLGANTNTNQRTRLLLKVLAVSDIVIYRSRADRLHNDLFQFLADASVAYEKHFTEELRAKKLNVESSVSSLGPALVIFHETQHTDVLGHGIAITEKEKNPAEKALKQRFAHFGYTINAYSSLNYVGTRTITPPTNFKSLLNRVEALMKNTTVRAPRSPQIIFKALKVLNDKFSGEIEKTLPEAFPDQYFTCTARCISCRARCSATVNHEKDDVVHTTSSMCEYQAQYENRLFLCRGCQSHGRRVMVVPKMSSASDNTWLGWAKYAWSGYVLECTRCGVIYRSRQHWYGNLDPAQKVVVTEICHVWPGGSTVLQGTHHAARRLLDGVQYMSDTISGVSAKPTKMLSDWMTDQIAPPYWLPNAEITDCPNCELPFTETDAIHHCRQCGKGFCDLCSSKRKPVPERGWGLEPVRVCDKCHDSEFKDSVEEPQIQARKVTEAVGSTLSYVKSAVDYSFGMLRDSARPTYWVPDEDCINCIVCSTQFGNKLRIHHCRCCGGGVCDPCSQERRQVPSRGWDFEVRVCTTCFKKKGPL